MSVRANQRWKQPGGNPHGFGRSRQQGQGSTRGAEEKTQEAAADAQAGNTEAAAGASDQASSLIDKAKGLLTDERIDQVAGAIKEKTPDQVDSVVYTVAEKGKEFNN